MTKGNITEMAGRNYLIVIGAMKAGTSTFFDYLSRHPAICGSTPKETEFFSENQDHKRKAAEYDEFWPNFRDASHEWALEASTGYTKWPRESGVADRMKSYGIRPRLVYVVRDPIRRIESHVNYVRRVSAQPISFTDTYPIQVSSYATQLEPYLNNFGVESLRLVDFDDVASNGGAIANEVFEWIGLPHHDDLSPIHANETESQTTSRVKRFFANKRTVRRLSRVAPPATVEAVERVLQRLAPHRPSHEKLTPLREAEIREILAPDMKRLREIYGFDTTRWGF